MENNLRNQFFKETKIAYLHSNREPYSSYVEWLENIIIGQKVIETNDNNKNN